MDKANSLFVVLGHMLVINQSVLHSLKGDDLINGLTEMEKAKNGKTTVTKAVPAFSTFFSKSALNQSLMAMDSDFLLHSLYHGLDVSDENWCILQAASAIRKELLAAAAKVKADYTFDDRLATFNGEELLRYQKGSVVYWRRTNNNTYSATLKQLLKVWDGARVVWKNRQRGVGSDTRITTVYSLSVSGYNRDADIYPDRVRIGCQMIQRYELEHIATVEGWSFEIPE